MEIVQQRLTQTLTEIKTLIRTCIEGRENYSFYEPLFKLTKRNNKNRLIKSYREKQIELIYTRLQQFYEILSNQQIIIDFLFLSNCNKITEDIQSIIEIQSERYKAAFKILRERPYKAFRMLELP